MHLVKNARSSYSEFTENAKQAKQLTAKRKLQSEADEIKKKKAKLDLSVISDQIIEEEHKLQAAHNILGNGSEMLKAALDASPKFLKKKVIEANNLLQLGTDKIRSIECTIKDLRTQYDHLTFK